MQKKKILVVDDDRTILDMLEDGLAIMGYDVETADNATGLKQLAQISKPDVIMLDVRMPGVDGISVCRDIRSSADTAHIPVVIVTGLSDKETKNDALLFGASAFLHKPFEIDQVRKTLEECIAKSNAKRGREK